MGGEGGQAPEKKKSLVLSMRVLMWPGMHWTALLIGLLFGFIAAIWFVLEIADSMASGL